MTGRPLLPCGTNAAYYRHLRFGEEPCDDCREARRTYMRAWHAERRAAREQEEFDRRVTTAADHRALAVLRRAHEDEYQFLYQRELRRLKEAG